KLAGRRDHQAERFAGPGDAVALDQLPGNGETEGHGLARSGLRGNNEVAVVGFFFDDGRLDGRQRVIAARSQRFREGGMDTGLLHNASAYSESSSSDRASCWDCLRIKAP